VGSASPILAWDQPPEVGAVLANPDYVFRKEVVRDLLLFWSMPGERACMLVGPPGCGKTTAVEQWHARLNWPLLVINAHKRLRAEDLFAEMLPNERGGLDFVDRPLVQAARNGWSVLINEINAADPGVTIALNDIAQSGSRVVVPQTGEIIEPHEDFRVFGTMNPPGHGISHFGRQSIDASTRERFMWIEVDYPSEEDEIKVILNAVRPLFGPSAADGEDPAAPFTLCATRMVQTAAEVRRLGVGRSDRPDALTDTMSTRVLARWARYWVGYGRLPGAPHVALRRAFTDGCDPEIAQAIHALVTLKCNVTDPRKSGTGQRNA
jgi:cobaltochelatase CobS